MNNQVAFAATLFAVVATLALSGSLGGTAFSHTYNINGTMTLFIQVVNSSTLSPLAGIPVSAGPISSPGDVVGTPDGISSAECIHGVPSGSTVENNGSVLYPNGSLVTFPACPMKQYVTDSSGFVSIGGTASEYYLVTAGGLLQSNTLIVGAHGTNEVSVVIPWPTGDAILSRGLPTNCAGSKQLAPSGIEILYETCTS